MRKSSRAGLFPAGRPDDTCMAVACRLMHHTGVTCGLSASGAGPAGTPAAAGPSRRGLRSARRDGRPPPGSSRPRRRPSPHRGAAAPATPGPDYGHASSPSLGRPRRSPAPGPAHAGGEPSPGRQPNRTEPDAPSPPRRPPARSPAPDTPPTRQYRNVTNHGDPPPGQTQPRPPTRDPPDTPTELTDGRDITGHAPPAGNSA